jgi:hypothetical protein
VGMPGFDAFGIAPQPIAHVLEKILAGANTDAATPD